MNSILEQKIDKYIKELPHIKVLKELKEELAKLNNPKWIKK
jgi:hypothetical protein